MKRSILTVLAAGMMFAGCMTQQMKSTPFYEGHDVTYTGKAEDRVNIWPLAYWREPVGSVLWPILSFSDDHFAVRPLYSRYDDEHNFLWPLGQYDSGSGDGRVFPVVWGKHHFDIFPIVWNHRDFHSLFPILFYEEEDYLTLFPFVWWDIDDNGLVLFPLFGHTKDSDWIAPVYYRDEDLTLVTPLFGMDKKGDNWLLPLYWHDEDVTWVTPLFGKNKQGDNWLIPLYASLAGDFFSPLWCGGTHDEGKKYESSWWLAPPLLSWGASVKGQSDKRFLLGLAGYSSGYEGSSHWLIPFWYHDPDTTLITPIYGKAKDSQWLFPVWYHDKDLTLMTPLYGKYKECSWFAPVYYKDDQDLVTPIWWQSCHHNTGETESWMIPPLLTGGGVNDDGTHYFYSPLGGFNGEQSGILPLYYRNDKGFYSLLFCKEADDGETETHTIIPPLLSWYCGTSESSWSKTRLLLGLYGHDTRSDGSTRCDWLFPLYHYDGRSGDIATLLFGRDTGLHSTDWWWLTRLVGHTTGERAGFWFEPFVNWGRDDKLVEMEKMMNADTLDASITGSTKAERDWDVKKKQHVTNDVFRTESAYSGGKFRFGFDLFGTTRSIDQEGGDNEYRYGQWARRKAKNIAGKEWREGKERTVSFSDRTEFGNEYLFGGKTKRVVNFDYDSKEKVFDGEFGESQAIFGFVWSSRDEQIKGGHSYSKRALFWRLWHYEELNGDSTTDMFPFITRDTKKNGYSKTSFLWRFFRHERDPEEGTSLDLFFIPLWRP